MFRRLTATVLLLLAASLAASLPAAAQDGPERRVALVIANDDYAHVGRLTNTANDAAAVAERFESLGYEVTRASNLDYAGFRDALRTFRLASDGADVSAIYYAGHGIEIDRVNYLIPVDAELATDAAVEFEAVPLDLVMLAGVGAKRFRLVILDACRNNPFLKTMTRSAAKRSIGAGLAAIEPQTSDTLIAFAAREGTVAFDGAGRHSPFAAALLKHMAEPGVEVGDLFRRVRDEVLSETNGAQEPFVYGSLSSKAFYINPPLPTPVAVSAPAAAPEGAPAAALVNDACRFAEAHWETVLGVNQAEYYEEHLRLFANCPFASLARLRLRDLGDEGARSVGNGASPGVRLGEASSERAGANSPDLKSASENPPPPKVTKQAPPKRKAAPAARKKPAPAAKAAPPRPAVQAQQPAPQPVQSQPKRTPNSNAACQTHAIRCK